VSCEGLRSLLQDVEARSDCGRGGGLPPFDGSAGLRGESVGFGESGRRLSDFGITDAAVDSNILFRQCDPVGGKN